MFLYLSIQLKIPFQNKINSLAGYYAITADVFSIISSSKKIEVNPHTKFLKKKLLLKKAFKSSFSEKPKVHSQNLRKSPKCILTKFELSSSCHFQDIVD